MRNYDGIIFDLDGTLWNAVEGIAFAWNEIFKKLEINHELKNKDVSEVMGYTVNEIAKKYFPEDIVKGIELIKYCCKEELKYLSYNNVKLYPNLYETLKELSGNYKLFIVSNCMKGYIEKFLEISKTKDLFQDYENAETTGLSKGQNIKLVMKRNNLKKVLYIGDTIKDYQATIQAGVDFVQAAYGFGKKIKKIDTINEIKEIIKYLNKKMV